MLRLLIPDIRSTAGGVALLPEGPPMSSDIRELVHRVVLFERLQEPELTGLSQQLTRRTFRRGTMIFHKDQAGDALYIVESGRVRIFRTSESGKELEVSEAGPGEVFGELALLDGSPRSASVEAVEDTVTHTLNRDEFLRYLATAPQLAVAVILLLSKRLRAITEYAESLAFLDLEARLARDLLQLGERHGVVADGVEIDLAHLNQTELANRIGATRERVNRALAAFRSQRLIKLRGKKIVLIDLERLKKRIY